MWIETTIALKFLREGRTQAVNDFQSNGMTATLAGRRIPSMKKWSRMSRWRASMETFCMTRRKRSTLTYKSKIAIRASKPSNYT